VTRLFAPHPCGSQICQWRDRRQPARWTRCPGGWRLLGVGNSIFHRVGKYPFHLQGDQKKPPGCCPKIIAVGSVQSFQLFQKHWILESNRNIADLRNRSAEFGSSFQRRYGSTRRKPERPGRRRAGLSGKHPVGDIELCVRQYSFLLRKVKPMY